MIILGAMVATLSTCLLGIATYMRFSTHPMEKRRNVE